jgi:hypothetical protein
VNCLGHWKGLGKAGRAEPSAADAGSGVVVVIIVVSEGGGRGGEVVGGEGDEDAGGPDGEDDREGVVPAVDAVESAAGAEAVVDEDIGDELDCVCVCVGGGGGLDKRCPEFCW